jgi:hypothetical protein
MPSVVILMKFPLALHRHAGGFTVLSGEIKSNYDNLQSTVAERRNTLPAARLQSKSGALKCEAAFRLRKVGRNERFVAATDVARRCTVRRKGKLFWKTPTEITLSM